MGLFDSKSKSKVSIPPPTPQELEILGINIDLLKQQLGAYREQLGQSGQTNEFVDRLVGQQQNAVFPEEMLAQARSACEQRHGVGTPAAAHCVESLKQKSAQMQRDQAGVQETQRYTEIDRLQGTGDQLQEQANAAAQQGFAPLTEEQLGQIRGSADMALQTGLSDIGRFADERMNQVRLNSVQRGLRPGDTPIQNEFYDTAIEANRLAQNYTNSIRGQQLQAELMLPFEEARVRSANLGAASDMAFRRQALEESLLESARNARLGFGQGLANIGAGLSTAFNPAATLGPLVAARTAQTTTRGSNTPSGIQQGGQLLDLFGQLVQTGQSLYAGGGGTSGMSGMFRSAGMGNPLINVMGK